MVEEYLGEYHVYERHRAGLPQLKPYFREMWRRRDFAIEMGHTTIRAGNSETVLGVLWNVLNPLLLAAVYYLLVAVLSGSRKLPNDYFPHLLAGLFAFNYIAGCMHGGASSVTAAGKIIMNTAFPRMLLPLSAVYIAVRRFLPTLVVYYIVFLIAGFYRDWKGVSFSSANFLAIPMFLLLIVFGAGMSMLLATSQVYFRDTSSFMPYILRIWLYVSPVLWYPDQGKRALLKLEFLNPLFSLLGGYGDLLVRGQLISLNMWITALGWALASLIIGALVFMIRERDFAVRL
jgi:ABC-type polysaccharide/polyol phosphate export permease